jgi:hypothetical protein
VSPRAGLEEISLSPARVRTHEICTDVTIYQLLLFNNDIGNYVKCWDERWTGKDVDEMACDLFISTLKMEVASSSSTVLTIYRTTCRHVPEDFNLNAFREFIGRTGALTPAPFTPPWHVLTPS